MVNSSYIFYSFNVFHLIDRIKLFGTICNSLLSKGTVTVNYFRVKLLGRPMEWKKEDYQPMRWENEYCKPMRCHNIEVVVLEVCGPTEEEVQLVTAARWQDIIISMKPLTKCELLDTFHPRVKITQRLLRQKNKAYQRITILQ